MLFGKPDRVVKSESDKLLYKLDVSWGGATLWAGIGVPFSFPTSRLYYIFEFKDEKLVSVIKEKNGRKSCDMIKEWMCW